MQPSRRQEAAPHFTEPPKAAPIKACSKCRQVLPYEAYHRKKGAPNGIRSACKVCIRAQARQTRAVARAAVKAAR